MAQFHQLDAMSYMFRLLGVKGKGTACLRIAETAAPGADITTNHKGGCTAPPALTHIGAATAAANGVEAV